MGLPPGGVFGDMKQLTITAAVGALAVVLAACGGNDNTSSNGSASTGSASSVLKDASGMALYTPNGETAAKVRCTGSCTSIWKPAPPGAVRSTASKVSAITRPDGSKQASVAGKPLYTFAEDSPGAVTGNGVSDVFGGRHFTWHVVKASGGSSSSAAAPSSNGGGYNNGY
jgi:predicted lipoprotein with Yx(FWY)xxD motif